MSDKRVDIIQDQLEELCSATSAIEELIRLKLKIPELRKFLRLLEKEEKQLLTEQKKIRSACTHTWEYGGHGHNDDWYFCTECGATEDR